MYTNLLNWLDFYETYLLRRPLQPDDHIFPAIGANGTSVHPNRPMSADVVQKKLPKWLQVQGLMVQSITQHTVFVVEERNTASCLRRLDNTGPWLAFDGGVGGQKTNM